MAQTITIPDSLYSRIKSLAQPFVDNEPADVIERLVDKEIEAGDIIPIQVSEKGLIKVTPINGRSPRERGATVDLDGTVINADSVSDLYSQVMEFLYINGHWDQVLKLSPYKTSAKRYLFSKTPLHPNKKDFFVPVKYRGLYMETHKNYKTAIEQLSRFLLKCGITLTYRGA